MSYLRRAWEIIPSHSYKIMRNCSKCAGKMNYINTHNFRVNANGKCVDVWLIYQCAKCKSTYNLSIYERVSPSKIDSAEYEKLLSNDVLLATQYGMDKELFKRNKAEVNLADLDYDIMERDSGIGYGIEEHQIITIYNPYDLKIRVDKILAKKFDLSRSEVKKLFENGSLNKAIATNGMEVTIRHFGA